MRQPALGTGMPETAFPPAVTFSFPPAGTLRKSSTAAASRGPGRHISGLHSSLVCPPPPAPLQTMCHSAAQDDLFKKQIWSCHGPFQTVTLPFHLKITTNLTRVCGWGKLTSRGHATGLALPRPSGWLRSSNVPGPLQPQSPARSLCPQHSPNPLHLVAVTLQIPLRGSLPRGSGLLSSPTHPQW